MPSNIIAINGVSEYNVPDRKMEVFLRYLEENAYRVDIPTRITGETELRLRDKYSPSTAYKR